jgi:hypothetical protein
MKALIYLRHDASAITGEDLERLVHLRKYARNAGYTVTEVWSCHAGFETPEDLIEWDKARQAVGEGRFDAVFFWHETQHAPYYHTRDEFHRDKTPQSPETA